MTLAHRHLAAIPLSTPSTGLSRHIGVKPVFAVRALPKNWTNAGPFEITADGNLITGVIGKPVIIQSDFRNFEMVVPQGDTQPHYWRDNTDGGQPWQWQRRDAREPRDRVRISGSQIDLLVAKP
jgi:hypothetical protein